MPAVPVADTFDQHRACGAGSLHRKAMIVFMLWFVAFAFLYRGELQMHGTLWPAVYRMKLTLYLCNTLLHGAMWLSFDESKACYRLGSLGALQLDTAQVLQALSVTLTLSLDDHRLVRLLDRNESYASQMAKSFSLNPSRPVPACGGYVPDGGGCYFNNLEASHLVLLLARAKIGLPPPPVRHDASRWW